VRKPVEPGTLPALVRTVMASPLNMVNRTGPVRIPSTAPPKGGVAGGGGEKT
jgi:hypothetical protein